MASNHGMPITVASDQEGSDPRIVTETEPLPIALFDGYGNPIESLDGAINMHAADVHHAVYNQFLHFDTATVTTLSVAATAGDYIINFTDASVFAVGDEIQLENGNLEPMFFNILAIAVNAVTLDTPINFDHPTGADVNKVYTNLAQAGLTTAASLAAPVTFTTHVPEGFIVHVTSMSIIMTDGSAMDFTKFGGMAALTNGCVLRAQSDGRMGHYTNWKSNFDMDSDAFPVRYQEKVGGGDYGLSAVYDITDATGAIVYLDGSLTDRFEILIRDDLTNLINFRIKLQGHYEGL